LRLDGCAPYTEDPECSRPYFRQLRQIRDSIAARALPMVGTDVLSMGMSHDFEVAIEEGATCVRVGTAIFWATNKTLPQWAQRNTEEVLTIYPVFPCVPVVDAFR